ncbi:MAG TPA: MlaD family protein [Syntrophales bacterium]|nr:MlaD family protein [Syntrophales bacterium]HQB14956.1 MlaD family protein [Syntrophales bacterium]
MNAISSEAKVGLFVLIGLIVLGYMSFQVGQRGFSFQRGYLVDVEFDNAAGLATGASVQIAGVEVGRVETIRLKNGRALVSIRLPGEVKLERDVTAAIKTHGILGDKYIEVIPGTQGTALLQAGESITRVERQADVDKLLNQLASIAEDVKTVTGSLSKVMGGRAGEESMGAILENTRLLTRNLNAVVMNNEANLRAMLENTRQLTGNLNRVVVQNDEKIAQVIESLRGASSQMEKTFVALNDITAGIQRGEGTVGQLVKDKQMAEKLHKTMASLQEVSDKINKGQGTIGKLVNDDETVNNLNKTLGGINKFVNKSEQFRTFISYRGEYLTDKSDAKSYLDLRIQPRQDYFYLLGLAVDPRGRRTVKDITQGGATTTITEWDRSGLLFNAQLGKRFQDVVLRGGIFESTGGVGLDFLTFQDKLRLTFEAFDFSVDRKAHLKAGGEIRLLKNIYLNAGWDDFISDQGNSSPYVGVSLRFEDEDLKYLLTSVPVPTK